MSLACLCMLAPFVLGGLFPSWYHICHRYACFSSSMTFFVPLALPGTSCSMWSMILELALAVTRVW